MKFCVSVALLISLVFSVAHGETYDYFVKGTWTVKYLVQDPHEVLVPSIVKSPGFQQNYKRIHRGFEVTVTSLLQPVNVQNEFEFETVSLPRELTSDPAFLEEISNITETSDAVASIFEWIDRNIIYDDDPGKLQDWKSALNRRSAHCVGRCLVAEQLLKTMNVNCRSVSGCLVDGDDAQFHRWIEVTYPGSINLPSEIGVTQDFIDPYHIIIAPKKAAPENAELLSDLGARIQVISETKDFWVTDIRRNKGQKSMLRRKMRPVRYAGSIYGKINNDVRGNAKAELKLNDRVFQTEIDSFGNFYFNGLTSGTYTLLIAPSWGNPKRIQGAIESRQAIFHTILIE